MRSLAIDSGNGHIKTLLCEGNEIIDKIFLPNFGILKTVKKSIKKLMGENGDLKIDKVGITGAGRHFLSKKFETPTVRTEILCQFRGVKELFPDVKTVLDGGKEDSKILILKDEVIEHFIMNNICSGGLGVYIDSICNRFNISLEQFSSLALKSENPINIPQKCAVLGMSSAVSALNAGRNIEDILKGVAYAIVKNFLSMVKGRKLKSPCVFTGGMSQIEIIHRTFEEELGFAIIVPGLAFFTGAYGASLYASKGKTTNLKEIYDRLND